MERLASDEAAQRDGGADAKISRGGTEVPPYFLEGGDAAEPHHRGRLLLAPLHVGQQVGAAGHQHGVRGIRGQEIGRLAHARGRDVAERGEAHHDRTVASTPASALRFLRAGSFEARPSPPSQGGATSNVSGHGTLGNSVGP